jgi:hypothetical protein
LIAAISHLAANKHHWSRTVENMASELGLEAKELGTVLDGFRGLFRKTPGVGSKTGKHAYGLQMRWALRNRDADENALPEDKYPTLSLEQTRLLMDFVMHSAEIEQNRRMAWVTNVVSVFAAVVAAMAAIYVAWIAATNQPVP